MEITAEKFEQELQKLEQRLERKFDTKLDTKFDKLEAKLDSVKTWFVGLMVTTVLVVTALMTTFVNINMN